MMPGEVAAEGISGAAPGRRAAGRDAAEKHGLERRAAERRAAERHGFVRHGPESAIHAAHLNGWLSPEEAPFLALLSGVLIPLRGRLASQIPAHVRLCLFQPHSP